MKRNVVIRCLNPILGEGGEDVLALLCVGQQNVVDVPVVGAVDRDDRPPQPTLSFKIGQPGVIVFPQPESPGIDRLRFL